MFLELLVEGSSDVPVVREVLSRRFHLREEHQFRIHPHRGKGKLPANVLQKPDITQRGLLDQLPAKLRGYAHLPADYGVVVLVDADEGDCKALRLSLTRMYQEIVQRPRHVLFRIAIEETESWLLADEKAVRAAYPVARRRKFPPGPPDRVIGAWERFAELIGRRPSECTGKDKLEWSEKVSPHLDLDLPKSPSLRRFITGVERLLEELRSN